MLRIIDGSGNAYRLQPGDGSGNYRLSYEPVIAKYSSSGHYDGGPGWEASLDEDQYQSIKQRFLRLVRATEFQQETRSKGSVMLLLQDDRGDDLRVIMRQDTPGLVDFLGELQTHRT